MSFEIFIQNCLTDTEVKAMELLHENIRSESFFGKPWPAAKNPAKSGKKLLYQSGDMQAGYMSQIEGLNIHFTNSVAYAGYHNEGASVPVTTNMKKFFWAMFYKASGATTKTAGGKTSGSRRNVVLTAEAEYWKGMALMKVGAVIKIPERRVMGDAPELDAAVKTIVDRNMKETIEEMMKNFEP